MTAKSSSCISFLKNHSFAWANLCSLAYAQIQQMSPGKEMARIISLRRSSTLSGILVHIILLVSTALRFVCFFQVFVAGVWLAKPITSHLKEKDPYKLFRKNQPTDEGPQSKKNNGLIFKKIRKVCTCEGITTGRSIIALAGQAATPTKAIISILASITCRAGDTHFTLAFPRTANKSKDNKQSKSV